MSRAAKKLRTFRDIVKAITKKAGQNPSPANMIENNLKRLLPGIWIMTCMFVMLMMDYLEYGRYRR